MGKTNRKGHRAEPGAGRENAQNHRSWAAQSAHRASAGPMQDKREKRQGTRRERKDRARLETWD